MGRGKSSTTAQQSNTDVVSVPSGEYPKSMESLIDLDGHISLYPDDYAEYSRDEVEAFLASRSYETNVIFNPDGKVVYMTSQWLESTVRPNLREMKGSVYVDGSSTGDGYVDMHNHPNNPGGIQIFSGRDIDAYAYHVLVRDAFGSPLPNKFAVRAHDGSKFELEYVGGGSRDYNNFPATYKRNLTKAQREARQKFGFYSETIDQRVHSITSDMDAWLRKNARRYGFEYRSNWVQ